MYNHDVGTLIRTGSQEQVKQLERSVANTQTRITSRKFSHIPDRESPAGQDRQATETNRGPKSGMLSKQRTKSDGNSK